MRTRLIPLALLASALPLGAQGLADASAIVGPQFVSYKFGSGAGARTVNELAIPFAVIVPFGSRFTFDISSSYANAQVTTSGTTAKSSISGLTDTQLRGNLIVGDNAALFTLGINLPTGRYTVPDNEQEAAGAIGSDFLVYPVSSMGNGFAATGGIALAKPIGSWNLGVGGSFRHSSAFDAFEVSSSVLRFEPGDEARLRVGLDRPVGDGRFTMGVTYSTYGKDAVNTVTFGTGDRALAQASLFLPRGSGGDFSLSMWNLYRAEGQLADSATAPWENVSNVNVAYGFTAGGLFIQPSAEGRVWQRDGNKAGTLGSFGVRLRFTVGGLAVNPSATYAAGTIYSDAGGPSTQVTGFRGMVLVRLR